LAVFRPKCSSTTSRPPCCIIPSGKGRSFIRDISTSQLTTALSHAPAMYARRTKKAGSKPVLATSRKTSSLAWNYLPA
jgi:hypothetical protein